MRSGGINVPHTERTTIDTSLKFNSLEIYEEIYKKIHRHILKKVALISEMEVGEVGVR